MAITISIKVEPASSISKISGWKQKMLFVKLKSSPKKGKANQELIKLLSKTFKITKNCIQIRQGQKSRNKLIFIEGIEKMALCDILKSY